MPARTATLPAPALPGLVSQRLSDQLALRLEDQIGRGGLRPGDRLPTEQALALQHGVSRTVVREAVHQLKARGLLRSRQGLGVFVAPPPAHRALQFDAEVLQSLTSAVQVREVRRAIEGETAALAAERAKRPQIAAIRTALQQLDRQVAAGGDGVAEDLAFHRAIAEATGNPHFVRLLEFLGQYLHEAMRLTRGHEATRADFMEAVRREHRAIVDAIAARDPAAAREAAVAHMACGESRLELAGLRPTSHRGRKRT